MHHPTYKMTHSTAFVTPVMEHWLEREIAQWVHNKGSTRRPMAPWANDFTTELHLIPEIKTQKYSYISEDSAPVLHYWYIKILGMCYPVLGMVHVKDPLLQIEESNPCSGGSGFPLSLSKWSFTICPTPYNQKYNVLSVSLNKTFPSFLPLRFQCKSRNRYTPRTTWTKYILVSRLTAEV